MKAPSLRSFRSPQGPDLRPIELIHRPGDGEHAIAFCVREGFNGEDVWQERFNIPAAELRSWFPEIINQLEEEAFYSINGMRTPIRSRTGKHRPSAFCDGLPHGSRRNVRWLTACSVDIDCYRASITKGQAIGALWDLAEAGAIPPWSMLVDSGRGVWAFWFLRVADGTGPVRCWPEALVRWNVLQRALFTRLASIGADANALDRARVTRVAGSWNRAAGKRVRYLIAADDRGEPILHTLEELEASLRIAPNGRGPVDRVNEADPERKLRGQRGTVGVWHKNLRRLQALERLRGGWMDGCRHHALYLLAGALQRLSASTQRLRDSGAILADELREFASMGPSEIELELERWASRCRPPLEPSAARNTMEYFRHRSIGNIRHSTIADKLKVTREEAAFLDSAGLRGWPPCAEVRGEIPSPEEPSKVSRRQAAEARRAVLAKAIEREGRVPSLRDLQAELVSVGLEASTRTVGKDLEALELENPRSRAATERRRVPEAPQLFPE